MCTLPVNTTLLEAPLNLKHYIHISIIYEVIYVSVHQIKTVRYMEYMFMPFTYSSEVFSFLLFYNFAQFICCSGVSAAISVTQQMNEMSLSCEEKGASGSKVELTEPGGYQLRTFYLSQRMYTELHQHSYKLTVILLHDS